MAVMASGLTLTRPGLVWSGLSYPDDNDDHDAHDAHDADNAHDDPRRSTRKTTTTTTTMTTWLFIPKIYHNRV
jgi:hypothetical protein